MTLDPAVRDLLVAIHLTIGPPWVGDDSLATRLATVQSALADLATFGDPAFATSILQRAIEAADAGRVRRADTLALIDAGAEP
jgi:hypothetical protein